MDLLQGAVDLAEVGGIELADVVREPADLGKAGRLGLLEHIPLDVVDVSVESTIGAVSVQLATQFGPTRAGGSEGAGVVDVGFVCGEELVRVEGFESFALVISILVIKNVQNGVGLAGREEDAQDQGAIGGALRRKMDQVDLHRVVHAVHSVLGSAVHMHLVELPLLTVDRHRELGLAVHELNLPGGGLGNNLTVALAVLGKEELALGLGEGFVTMLADQVQVDGSLLPARRVLARVEGVLAEVDPILGTAGLAGSSATALFNEEFVDRSVCVLVLHTIVMAEMRDRGDQPRGSCQCVLTTTGVLQVEPEFYSGFEEERKGGNVSKATPR